MVVYEFTTRGNPQIALKAAQVGNFFIPVIMTRPPENKRFTVVGRVKRESSYI